MPGVNEREVLQPKAHIGEVLDTPGTWTLSTKDLVVSCKACGNAVVLCHEVRPGGEVNNSFVCQACPHHVWLQLEGWSEGYRPRVRN